MGVLPTDIQTQIENIVIIDTSAKIVYYALATLGPKGHSRREWYILRPW